MKMKKLAVATAVAAAMGAPLSASAYENGIFEYGVLVPWAKHAGSSAQTTVVGLISNNDACYSTTGSLRVAWVFHDQDSDHVSDGEFTMTANDMYGFNWGGLNKSGTTNVDGYLVFVGENAATIDPTAAEGCLAANAFYVDVPASDVAYVPTVPLDSTDFLAHNPRALNATSLKSLFYGSRGADYIYARHYIDGAAGGNDTSIVLWTTLNQTGTYTVYMLDDEQNNQSGNLVLSNTELNIINPEDVTQLYGFTLADAPDGLIIIDADNLDGANDGTGVAAYSFSYVTSTNYKAVQTLINPATDVNHGI